MSIARRTARRHLATPVLAATVAAGLCGCAQTVVDHLPPESGGGSDKVVICHKGRTIVVAESALAAHLAHGDTSGPCP